MAKKKKNSGAVPTSRSSVLTEENDNYSPFSRISEKDAVKVAEKKKGKSGSPVKCEKKDPVVVGYDPNARFSDILDAWEHGRSLDGITKRMKSDSKVVETGKSFAEIFAQWEDRDRIKAQKKREKKQIKPSAPYVPTMDFASILDSYEGKKKPARQNEPEEVEEDFTEEELDITKPAPFIVPVEEDEEEEVQDETKKPAWSFSQIYAKWDSISDENSRIEKAVKENEENIKREPTVKELEAMKPQATLDLHGMYREDAALKVREFLKEANKRKLRKISIIPGKGLHSKGGKSLLLDVVLSEIRLSGTVSRAWHPKEKDGGSGTVWIILKSQDSTKQPS